MVTAMELSSRGRALTVCSVLFGVLAVSNFLKPLQLSAETGFVLFGQRLNGAANAIAAPLFGLYLLVYARGIWRLRRFALPMSVLYAAYVVANLVLFTVRAPPPPGSGALFGLVYAAVALGVSSGTAYLLARRRLELR